MSSSSSSSADWWAFLSSNSAASSITRSVVTAALAGGATYYATRPSSSKSIPPSDKDQHQPPIPPAKDPQEGFHDTLARSTPSKSKLRSNKDAYTSASDSGSDDEGKRVRFEGAQRPFTKPLPVAVFWDVDNCSPPTGSSGRHLVQAIRKHLLAIDTGTGPDKEELGRSGPILSFKAYLELSSAEGVGLAQVTLRSELQGSGVSLIDTPKSGRKDVADKMIIADIMAFALDVPPPARVVLISGDRDFAYPLSLIRGRGYQVILITPPIGAVPILQASANHVASWRRDVLGLERDGYGRPYNTSTPSKAYNRSTSPGPSGRKTPPPPSSSHGGAESQPMATSTSQQGITSNSTPYKPPPPPESTNLTGPGAAPVPSVFQPLVQVLEEFKKEGQPRPLRSKVALRLITLDKDVYEKAGASSWRDYVAVAVAADIVVLGNSHGTTGFEWIALRTLDSPNFQTRPASNGQNPVTPKKNTGPKQSTTSWDGDDDDAVSATDGIFTPPSSFEPLFDAIVEAERITGRSPPYTDVVGERLHKSVVSGKILDPFSPLGVKSFGTYITAAFKQRVAKLVPSDVKERAALAVMPAYQAYLDSVRRGEVERQGPWTPAGKGKDVYEPPAKRGGILPNLQQKASSTSLPQSLSSGKGTPKKSAYDAKPGLLLPHSPSGTKIAPLYFPLANVLLAERAKGNFYTTDNFLFPWLAKHKHIGSQLRSSDAFAKYLEDAERAEIITLEPGFKPGVRHVRLASRLHDPKEREGTSSGDSLPQAGADPYTTSPPRATAGSSEKTQTSNEPTKSSGGTSTAAVASETPSVEDRKRFKPLMDVMFALRKYDPPMITPRRSMVHQLLTKKHCPDSSEDDPDAMLAWLGEHGANSIGDYTRQAEKFGFVVFGREERDDGAQGKKTVRLAEKYETRL